MVGAVAPWLQGKEGTQQPVMRRLTPDSLQTPGATELSLPSPADFLTPATSEGADDLMFY